MSGLPLKLGREKNLVVYRGQKEQPPSVQCCIGRVQNAASPVAAAHIHLYRYPPWVNPTLSRLYIVHNYLRESSV